jgi:hypothetical protein
MKAVLRLKWGGAPAVLGLALLVTGCGTPGAPLPPSLNLPDPVNDLTAVRTGNQIALTWTMPKRNTEKMLLKNSYPVRICRKEAGSPCEVAPSNLMLAPGAAGTFIDTLPAAETLGAPRSLSYFVELNNPKGRSAGHSNPAQVLAGEAPAPVVGLTAEVRKAGIALRWRPDGSEDQRAAATFIRLRRKLLTPQMEVKSKTQAGLPAQPPEPVGQSFLIEPNDGSDGAKEGLGRALDGSVRFGQVYEYRAQRVARIVVDGKTLEIAGPFSEPVRVETLDVFPPEIPTGLAAVPSAGDAASGPSIDLSWQPVADADLAGYAVYRREGEGKWQRISPSFAVVGPAFHDQNVQVGHSYRYAVTAIDEGGHASARSVETEETVPNP